VRDPDGGPAKSSATRTAVASAASLSAIAAHGRCRVGRTAKATKPPSSAHLEEPTNSALAAVACPDEGGPEGDFSAQAEHSDARSTVASAVAPLAPATTRTTRTPTGSATDLVRLAESTATTTASPSPSSP